MYTLHKKNNTVVLVKNETKKLMRAFHKTKQIIYLSKIRFKFPFRYFGRKQQDFQKFLK